MARHCQCNNLDHSFIPASLREIIMALNRSRLPFLFPRELNLTTGMSICSLVCACILGISFVYAFSTIEVFNRGSSISRFPSKIFRCLKSDSCNVTSMISKLRSIQRDLPIRFRAIRLLQQQDLIVSKEDNAVL